MIEHQLLRSRRRRGRAGLVGGIVEVFAIVLWLLVAEPRCRSADSEPWSPRVSPSRRSRPSAA